MRLLLLLLCCQCLATEKVKLYCFYTPLFKPMLEHYFLPSVQDDFEIIVREYPQECETGTYHSRGWNQTMLHKLELLQEAIYDNWDTVFVYSDIDIIFFQPMLQTALDHLGSNDLAIQQGWPRDGLCAGFFLMRGNERTKQLIDRAIELLEKSQDDQVALQRALTESTDITWTFLPSHQFPNGNKVLNGKQFSPNCEITLDPSIILFHANCVRGIQNKYHFLDLALETYQKNRPLDLENLPTLRTKQYTTSNQIVIFSAPRTGSSLLYNVVRFLFEDEENFHRPHDVFDLSSKVLKTHKYDAVKRCLNALYFVPIRHPIDASISNFRISPNSRGERYAKLALNSQVQHLTFAEKMKEKGEDVRFIRFEDFQNDLDYLLNFIEQELSISISPLDANILKTAYKKEHVFAAVESLPNFKQFLPISGFHGLHVSLDPFTPPQSFLDELYRLLPPAIPLYTKYGYFQ